MGAFVCVCARASLPVLQVSVRMPVLLRYRSPCVFVARLRVFVRMQVSLRYKSRCPMRAFMRMRAHPSLPWLQVSVSMPASRRYRSPSCCAHLRARVLIRDKHVASSCMMHAFAILHQFCIILHTSFVRERGCKMFRTKHRIFSRTHF